MNQIFNRNGVIRMTREKKIGKLFAA
ncbi:uncharacterized protein METZ01_LOCUS239889 [marine metagenome]|uniref:Uncharacterized protein n=1 Tax=marine metagenome TaxID=408172 RepID=A0A382HIZ6_9ZZZZ